MAIVVRTNPVAGATASFPDDYNNQNTKYLAGQRGYVRADLDDYTDGSTAPEVVVGSEFEVDGDIVVVQTANEAISGIAAIADDNVVYVYYDVSAEEFLASTTAPTYSTPLGGWYNGADRALFKLYKDSSGDYDNRRVLGNGQDAPFFESFTTAASGTWIAPFDAVYKFTVIGGGGGGGGVATSGAASAASGGGGGGTSVKLEYIPAGTSCAYTVGAGGNGGSDSGTDGTIGTTSTITLPSGTVSGLQGGAGTGSTSGAASGSGNGGIGSGGDYYVRGEFGGLALSGMGGWGGSSTLGSGGTAVTGDANGISGTGPGAASGGSVATDGNDWAAADGEDGGIYIEAVYNKII